MKNKTTLPAVGGLWPSNYDNDEGDIDDDDDYDDDDGAYLPRNSFPRLPLVICQRNLL